jgi:hypothetical protein
MTQPEDNEVPQSEISGVETPPAKPTLWRVMFFSFFVVPFLIATGCVALFTGVSILVSDEPTVESLLDDVRHGYRNKRWQGAYHLVALLDGPNAVALTPENNQALVAAFEESAEGDKGAVRQYLALAMGCAGNAEFVDPLLAALGSDPTENTPFLVRALGRLGDGRAVPEVVAKYDDDRAAVRLECVIALGAIDSAAGIPLLQRALQDPEPNVQWDAAIALAKLGDNAGQQLLIRLMDRSYLSGFEAVDANETDRILTVAVQSAALLQVPALDTAIASVAATDPNITVRNVARAVLDQRDAIGDTAGVQRTNRERGLSCEYENHDQQSV